MDGQKTNVQEKNIHTSAIEVVCDAGAFTNKDKAVGKAEHFIRGWVISEKSWKNRIGQNMMS